jgi:hypothetical protein
VSGLFKQGGLSLPRVVDEQRSGHLHFLTTVRLAQSLPSAYLTPIPSTATYALRFAPVRKPEELSVGDCGRNEEGERQNVECFAEEDLGGRTGGCSGVQRLERADRGSE